MDEPTDADALQGAARLLQRLLAEVEADRLRASSGRDVAMVRRIEGAAAALEAAAHHPSAPMDGGDQ
jgi:hypothetical protein